MHPTMLSRPIADRPTAGDARHYRRIPETVASADDGTPQVPYFPEGGVAAPPFMIVNPLSHGPESPEPGGITGSPNLLVGPADARWIELRDGDEQGKGVDPNRRWPRQFHSEAYDFSSLYVMPFPDQIGPKYTDQTRPEKAGWSVPKYVEQYEASTGENSIADLMQTRDPASQAFAVGWGYVG